MVHEVPNVSVSVGETEVKVYDESDPIPGVDAGVWEVVVAYLHKVGSWAGDSRTLVLLAHIFMSVALLNITLPDGWTEESFKVLLATTGGLAFLLSDFITLVVHLIVHAINWTKRPSRGITPWLNLPRG